MFKFSAGLFKSHSPGYPSVNGVIIRLSKCQKSNRGEHGQITRKYPPKTVHITQLCKFNIKPLRNLPIMRSRYPWPYFINIIFLSLEHEYLITPDMLLLGIITYLFPNFDSGLVKPALGTGQGWVITPYIFLYVVTYPCLKFYTDSANLC